MAVESLQEHARRKDIRRHVDIVRRRVLPVIVVWWLLVAAFAVGFPPLICRGWPLFFPSSDKQLTHG